MTLIPTSVRAKLTLTAVVVMGFLFILLGTVVEVVGREQIMASVDAELARKAQDIIRAHHDTDRLGMPPPPFRQENGPLDHGPDRRDGDDRSGQDQGSQGSGVGGPFPMGRDGNGPPDGPRRGGPGGPGGPGGRGGYTELLRRLKDIGDPTIAVGPHFISLSEGPPFVPPEMREPYDRGGLLLAKTRGSWYSTVTLEGAGSPKLRVYTKVAKDANGRLWAVQIPYPLGEIDTALATLNRTLLLLLPFGLALTAAACLFLMKRVMLPIRAITQTADSISGEDLTGRLTIAGSDEFAQLGTTINGMLGRLETAFATQRETMARLEAVLKQQRRFTADASHELKTPLAVIKANTGLMLHGSDLTDDAKESVQAIDAAATRMNRLVQGLMVLARAEAGSTVLGTVPFDLRLAVQNAIDQVHRPAQKQIVYVDLDQELRVEGSERDVERVFVNLVDNACRHTAVDGHIEVRVTQDGKQAVVTVSDNGEGIGAEHLPHLFERFYRADSARSSETGGTGLGLAICKGIIEAAGGAISIDSELGHGTKVTVRLPLSE